MEDVFLKKTFKCPSLLPRILQIYKPWRAFHWNCEVECFYFFLNNYTNKPTTTTYNCNCYRAGGNVYLFIYTLCILCTHQTRPDPSHYFVGVPIQDRIRGKMDHSIVIVASSREKSLKVQNHFTLQQSKILYEYFFHDSIKLYVVRRINARTCSCFYYEKNVLATTDDDGSSNNLNLTSLVWTMDSH